MRAASAQDNDSDLVTRVDRMEETIRDLTGRVEQLQYHSQQLEQQVQRLQQQIQGGGAVGGSSPPPTAQYSPPPPAQYSPPPSGQYSPPPQYSPAPAAQYSPPAAVPPAGGVPSDDSHHDAFNPRLEPGAPGAPRPLGTSTTATEPPPIYDGPQGGAAVPRQEGGPLNLSSPSVPPADAASPGQLPPPPPINPSSTGGAQASLSPTLPADMSPKDEYQLGRGYFERKDYPLAVNTFRAFLHQYPGDRLTPEAQYWLGESLFQSQQYHDAAEAFLSVSTKYGTNARAPDALLRLGQSLLALGQKEPACASLGEVLRKYPRASLSVKESVAREQKRAHC
jgi:tol-pal system protein YbgF